MKGMFMLVVLFLLGWMAGDLQIIADNTTAMNKVLHGDHR